MTRRAPSTRTSVRVAAMAAVLTAALAGCRLPGMLLGNLPQGKVPAVYTPPDRPTAVLVDDPDDELPTMHYAGLIAGAVESDLERSETIARFAAPHRIDEMRMNEEDFTSWSIAEVGRRLGVEQVIYIRVARFDLRFVSDIYRPVAAAEVKIIDARTGRRLFPAPNRPAWPVTVKMLYQDKSSEDTPAAGVVLGRRLADRLGEEIAKLFYDHEPRRVGSGYTE